MHEMSIAQSLVKIVREEMAKNQVESLIKVTVCCGRINAVVPDALHMAFEALTRDTPLQGAELDIVHVPLRLACGQCGSHFEPEDGADTVFFHFPCPACGQDIGHEVVQGRELHVESIEAE